MNGTTARALKGDEIRNSRYLDALHAFRTHSGLCMTQGAPEGGGAGGDGGGAGGGQQQQQQQDQQQQQQQQQRSADKGFPENTPVVEMTPAQQAAYYKHQAQKHEDRNKALLAITGGKHGDDLKAVFDEYGQLKSASQTDAEKALEDAKKQTRAEVAIESVRAAFDLVLPDDMPEDKKTSALGVLNLAAFLTPDGKVDTAKVKTHAASLAPAKDSGQQQQRRDWGGGNRQTGGQPLGAAGAAEAERRFKQKSTTNS
jgi:hypothetical protein